MSYRHALSLAVEAAREAGALLVAELHRPGGPRSRGAHVEADAEAEALVRARLVGGTPWGFLGEETGSADGVERGHVWVVDVDDGTRSFLSGHRGTATSIALVRDGTPVLGVVYAFASPDDRGDLIAWAEGEGPVTRNGAAVAKRLDGAQLTAGALVLASSGADENATEAARCVAPGRFMTSASLAYRLALVAAGAAVAAISLSGPASWDYAAGHALLRGAGGELVDQQGKPVRYGPRGEGSVRYCFGGPLAVITELFARPWRTLLERTRPGFRAVRYGVACPLPGRLVANRERLSRAHGCLLGQLAGDALGSLVEFESAADIALRYPAGVRELVDGGTWGTLAGQPTDDSELALMLARSILRNGRYDAAAALDAYVHWLGTSPFDVGATTRAALGAAASGTTAEDRLALARASASLASEANGSLMRVSPLGIYGAARPELAVALAREDSALTHPNEVCREACAAFVAALASAIGKATDGAATCEAARAEAARGGNEKVIAALDAARTSAPERYDGWSAGWVLVALQNAFYQLLHAPSLEEGVVATVMAGGDTDTNGAIAGALLGAVYGRDAVPSRWRDAVLSCRALVEVGARHARPPELWAVDALTLAETLVVLGEAMV